ncbi:TPA: hypothetical protein NY308_001503 [Proteus mirabilis]|nr:hypothetical protein [Proteus mirabilis]HBC5641710.1 hypothetical protein [Proteus mirabilis]HBC5644306.1 hypothetical protein [Proteus mirabilis]HCK1901779.1 hypothetical protein [Proteus mirabilis]HEI8679482.1 hypothetical protein [Proteus mirabilis]
MLDFFKNIINSATDSASDRIKNPLVGAFIFAWIACNWNIVFIMLFSSKNIEEKIGYALDVYSWKYGFWSPVLVAFLYVLFVPIANLLIDIVLKKFVLLSLHNQHEKKIAILEMKKVEEKNRAEVDIAYEKIKTGAEKEIQEIRESITESKEREGQLTQEAEELKKEISTLKLNSNELKKSHNEKLELLNNIIKKLEDENNKLNNEVNVLSNKANEILFENNKLKSKAREIGINF